MSNITWKDLKARFAQLYEQQEYVQARELVNEAMKHLSPEWRLYNWRMCMEAKLNDTDQALQTLRESLSRGCWCDPAMWRDDEDLKALEGLPEYEQLLSESQRLFSEARTAGKLELEVLQPEPGTAAPYPLAITLHGDTGNAKDSVPDWQALTKKGWLVAAPFSSQRVAHNGAVWNDHNRVTQEVQAHYTTLREDYALDPERVIVGGFWAGGGQAIRLAVSGALNAKGFVVVGPFLPDLDEITPYLEGAKARGVRGYVVMGLQQGPEMLDQMRTTIDLLNSNGVLCLVEQRPDLEQEFPPDFDLRLEKALAFIFPASRGE